MKVKELIGAMDNIVELVHLIYADGVQFLSNLGAYEIFSIPEKYESYEVSHFYIYDVDGNTHVDIAVKK
jgi:hypothetical protein